MAHAGTPADLAKQPAATGTSGEWFWRTMIALIVVAAIGLGTVMATSYIAGSKGATGVSSAPDRTDDQIQALPGAAPVVVAPADPKRVDHLRGNMRGTTPFVDQVDGRRGTMTLSGTSVAPKDLQDPKLRGNLP